ncbi:MAG: diguanylate cyclase [Pseudomonadota bacterium]
MNSQVEQTQAPTQVQALLRPVAVLCGTAVYVIFLWGLMQQGMVAAKAHAYYLLLACWSAGMVVLVIWPQWLRRWHQDLLAWARALWSGVGAIALAMLVPHPVRMLLLVAPLFSILYGALYLSRLQVNLLAVLIWMAYAVCGLQLQLVGVDPQLEFMYFLAFALILAGGLFVSWEMLRVREQLHLRNQHLREVMERMQTLALQDELTGVHNRRYILEVLARQKALADRGQQPFTVCYCDLDHFKAINDAYGHSTGDMVLQKFARMAAKTVRNVDFVARIGGEEFLLVLVGADKRSADAVVQRLARRTKQLSLPHAEGQLSVSVSVGVTSYRPEETVDAVLKRADEALYAAKAGGRDKVVVAS